jgi:hypothetical protein
MIILQRNNIEILKHVDLDGRDLYTVRQLHGGDCYIDQFSDLDGAIEHVACLPNGFDLRVEKIKSQKPSIGEVALIMLLGCASGMLFINWLGLL